MADTWGGVSLPVAVPSGAEALGDRALWIVGDYLKACLNAFGSTAWASVMAGKPACGAVYLHDPRDYGFVETYLPAIFLYRREGRTGEVAAFDGQDILEDASFWTLLYVFPPAQQAIQDRRDTFANAVHKVVAAAIERYRDTSFVATGDADNQAGTTAAAPTSIKLQFATSTSQQVFTGAALNGAIGVGNIDPRRPITVTLGGTVGSFTNGSTIVVEGIDVVGQPITNTLTIDTGAIPGTLTGGNDFASVTKVTVAAQAGTAGTIQVGTGSFAGKGSLYLEKAGLQGLTVAGWKAIDLTIPMKAPAPPRTYFAVEITLAAIEQLDLDLTLQSFPNTGTDAAFLRSDGSNIQSAKY